MPSDKFLVLLLLVNLMLRDYGKGFSFWLWILVFVSQVLLMISMCL